MIISQTAISFLLCMLAWGWTITKQSLDMEDLDITIPIAIFILVIHCLIGGLIFLDSEEHHKWHDYQGVQGVLLCVFRVIMFAAFIYGLQQTKA